MIRPEITYQQRAALGRLLAGYAAGVDWVHVAPEDPAFQTLTKMVGSWVEQDTEGRFKITNYGRNAFYTGKIVHNP